MDLAALAEGNVASLRDRYAALADPLDLLDVNPRDIRRRCLMHAETRERLGSKYHDWGRVLDGDWDLSWRGAANPDVQGGEKWEAVLARYTGGATWEETGIVDHTMERIARGEKVAGGLRTRRDVLDRYRRLDDVYEDIRSNGFRPAHLAGGEFKHNLCVSIGRDGRLMRSQGANHRLPIAVVLGLPSVPVYVLTRHRVWQETRERFASLSHPGSEVPPRPNHPDLRGLCT